MFYGELALHSPDYQNGHETGSVRAYDDAISFFERRSRLDTDLALLKNTYTNDDIIAILGVLKDSWIEHCNTFGMASDEAHP